VQEGLARIIIQRDGEVFYNPIQIFNRDLTVAAINSFKILAEKEAQKGTPNSSKTERVGFSILDALSASGLRAIRYALEIPGLNSVTAVDNSTTSILEIQRNIEVNGVTAKVDYVYDDTVAFMHSRSREFSVIDLDPYGSAAPFLDAAITAVKDGGLLCVTCTDAAVWASSAYPEKCFALYGGIPSKGDYSHEAGIRIILHAIATCAARYGITVDPLLCVKIDFYARLFVRLRHSPLAVKLLGQSSMVVYTCDEGCGSWTQQSLGSAKAKNHETGSSTYKFARPTLNAQFSTGGRCLHCGSRLSLAGPMYAADLHNSEFIALMQKTVNGELGKPLRTRKRINGLLVTVKQEIEFGPFFFLPNRLAKVIRCPTPPLWALQEFLLQLGYTSGRSHCRPGSIKTDAPWHVIWEAMR
ncbi:N2,N2-dimethylguanosine tRNA methyltransferase, partial [Ascobolus immersus RN42]